MCAPSLVDLEVASVLRRAATAKQLDERRAAQALADLMLLPLRRVGHIALLGRMWELRDNVTVYDGAYVAPSELASATLVTADARLSRAPGTRCEIEILI